MNRQLKWCALALVAALATACGEEQPAVEKGSVLGTITRASDGTGLTGVQVGFKDAAYSATTDAQGKYNVADVEPGTYTVTFTREGFVTRERSNVVVGEGAAVTLDLTLSEATGTAQLSVMDGCANAPLEGATLTRSGEAALTTDSTGKVSIAGLAPGEYSFAVAASGFLPAELVVTVTAGGLAEKEAILTCQSKAAADEARAYLATLTIPDAVTTATSVHDRLYDTLTTNDPFVISVQAPADYAKGHIPGAINVPWKSVANDETLELLGDPASRTSGVVNYCYTGHTGAISAGVIGLLGYKSANMKYGIVSWTRDATARGTIATEPDQTRNFATETTPRTATAIFEPPRLAFEEAQTPRDVVKLAARAYLSNPQMLPTISAQALFDNLNDGNAANDPFIISVRKPEDYAKGHIPGAINVLWTDIAKEENLRKIPTDREVVVYCYTGHTGGVATAVLGMLGYHKVKNLKFGMVGWTQDATVRATTAFTDAADAHDFPITTGTSP